MKKSMFLAVALCAAMVSCSKTAKVSEEKEELPKTASQEISAIRTANDLAKYGYEVESASALIEAANILAGVPTQALDAEVEQGEKNADEVAKGQEKSLCPQALLATAKEYAGDDATLLAMADKVENKLAAVADGARGAVGGPKHAYGSVNARSYTYYDAKFWANEIAEIVVSGDGDTDLDLYVYDQNGNLIASDTDYTDDCYVRFCPRWTGLFRIKIVNRGGVYNNYVIATN